MNIGEGNDFYKVVRALREPGARDEDAIEAAGRLATRSHSALSAGPLAAEVQTILSAALDALACVYEEFGPGLEGYTRPVETHEPVGGVL